MQESGIVTAVCGGTVTVMIARREACGSCNACGLMSGTTQNVFVDVKNTVGAEKGDTVMLSFSAKTSLLSTVIAYVIPLGMLILGVLLGYTVIAGLLHTAPDPTAAFSGLGFAALSFGIVKLFDPVIRKKAQFELCAITKKGVN